MIILIHVIIALASIAVASYAFFSPSIKKILVSYGLIIATAASGSFLIVTASSNVLQSCLVGLSYVTAVSMVTVYAHLRLCKAATQEN